MSYKFSRGAIIVGDISGSDDSDRNTGVDFEEDYIALVTGGSSGLVLSGSRVGIGTDSPTSKLHVGGTFSLPIPVIDGVSNAIGSAHHTVLLNADSGNCPAQLPSASGIAGRIYVFKRIDSSHNHVKVQSNGSEEIEGSTNDLDMNNQNESFTLQCDGTRWWIISDNHV